MIATVPTRAYNSPYYVKCDAQIGDGFIHWQLELTCSAVKSNWSEDEECFTTKILTLEMERNFG